MNEILYIEHDPRDITKFKELLSTYFIHPNIEPKLVGSLWGLDSASQKLSMTDRFLQMESKIFKYILDNELYNKLSFILIDINIFHNKKDKDMSGLKWMSDFRRENALALPEKYKLWNQIIPIIALTKYDMTEYEWQILKHAGYLNRVFNKNDVTSDSNTFLTTLENTCAFMSKMYPLFYNREQQQIYKKLDEICNNTNSLIKINDELKQISQLVLIAQIASMEKGKREKFTERFTDDVIKYVTDNALLKINDTDTINFKTVLKDILESPSMAFIKLAGLIDNQIISEKIPEVLQYMTDIVQH